MYRLRLPRRSLFVLIALVALCGMGRDSWASSASDLQHGYRARQIVVKIYETVADPGAAIAQIAATYDLAVIGQFGSRPIYWLQRNTPDDDSVPDKTPPGLAHKIEAQNQATVEYAEPNFVGETPEERRRISWARGDPSEYAGQWAIAKLRLPLAQALTHGQGQIVAVLDTGVDMTHPALQGRLVPGHDFVDGDDDPSEVGVPGQDISYGHGTHVAGLVALAAPAAKIMPLRVLDSDGSGDVWVLAEALQYAVDHGASVINISISTLERTRLLADIIGKASCHGSGCSAAAPGNALVVMAAGNSGSQKQEFPAAEAKTVGGLSVAATTEQDTLADFSNYGPWVSLAAPGDRVLSSVPGGGYASWSGTSMAAPLVAGTAALVRAACPALNPQQVADWMQATSVGIAGQSEGRIDATAALQFPAATGCQGLKLVFLPLLVR